MMRVIDRGNLCCSTVDRFTTSFVPYMFLFSWHDDRRMAA